MMEKLFKVGGVSCSKNGYKVRFANDITRVKVLSKTDSDIQLMELPKAMTKPELANWLKTTALYENPQYREAIDCAIDRYEPKVVVRAKAKAKVKSTPNMESLRARAEAESEAAQEVVES
jgi:hypothetical protein